MRCSRVERKRTIGQFVVVTKQIAINFSCVCPTKDNEFRHNSVKVAADPLGYRLSTATLTML